MNFSDETLMAFADGELDDATRREVERAIDQDPVLAEKIRLQQVLRTSVFDAFASTLHEEVPRRLQAARSGKVVHLDSVRPLRTMVPVPPPVIDKPRWSWREWSALAATLVVGVLAGLIGSQNMAGREQFAAFDAGAASLKAEGKLATALTTQVAGAQPDDPAVRIGASFISKEDIYCRSFMLPGMAGLACRSAGEWRIPVLAASVPGAAGADRLAGSGELPPAVLDAIEERMIGKKLDANGERAAEKLGWRR